MLSQVKEWLETHPGWEVVSDSDDSGDEDSQGSCDENGSKKDYNDFKNFTAILSQILLKYKKNVLGKRHKRNDREKTEEEKANEMLKKAKVEDDEYKTEEQTYYRYA